MGSACSGLNQPAHAACAYRVLMTIFMVVSCLAGAVGVIPSLLSSMWHPGAPSGPISVFVLNVGLAILGGVVGFFSAK